MGCRVVVLLSFGDAFGKPTTCNGGCVSVKRLKNPPASLRKHDGRNKDLRRHIIDHGGVVIDEIAATLCGMLKDFFEKEDLVAITAAMALGRTKLAASPRVLRHILNMALPMTVVLGVGCVKGQHRSVAVVEHLVREGLIRAPSLVPYKVVSYHRELEKPRAATQKTVGRKHKHRR